MDLADTPAIGDITAMIDRPYYPDDEDETVPVVKQ